MSDWVIQADEANFETTVLERSRAVPVIVDFWAPWCGPCRSLTPLLEKLAAAYEGKFVLAKVNVDENPALAQAFRIQGIPRLIAFRDGRPVADQVGALPEPPLREFIDRLLPTAAELAAAAAQELAAAGREEEAEAQFRISLTSDPRCGAALVGLARLLGRPERGAYEEAMGLLERVPPGAHESEAERLAAEIRIRQAGQGDLASLEDRVAASPDDLAARVQLGQLLAAQGRHEEALSHFLGAVRLDRHFDDDAARKAMLDIFELLGGGHPLVDRYRDELGKVLFR